MNFIQVYNSVENMLGTFIYGFLSCIYRLLLCIFVSAAKFTSCSTNSSNRKLSWQQQINKVKITRNPLTQLILTIYFIRI